MSKLKIAIVGSGGREHALAWCVARSSQVDQLYIAPGNAGTSWDSYPTAVNVPIAVEDVAGLLAFARREVVDLTIVGPEVALATGIVDRFQEAGLPIFGPTRAAAQLESSKAFAKAFMHRHAIPTAASATFDDYEEAYDYLTGLDGPVVMKASGLAAGKGVVVCDSVEQAQAALQQMMVARIFGPAGETVVIEERLYGRELSLMAFSDGRTLVPMLPARDHKRVYDGDKGANTGGMGAFAPAPDIDEALVEEVTRTVLQPAVAGMAALGTPYVGVLYAGLMLTDTGLRVLEFNCRFGDPETQVVLPLLDSDLVEIMLACVAGRLDQVDVAWRPGACATVVMAAPGYPGSYPQGLPIHGLKEAGHLEDVIVFHAGTADEDGQLVTAGGRVLAVTAVGSDLPAALEDAYTAVDKIQFQGAHYRRDIGGIVETLNE